MTSLTLLIKVAFSRKIRFYELSRQIDNKIKNTVEILKNINNDDIDMSTLVESSIKIACKLGIYSNNDFNQMHKRRLVLKRIDSNSNLQTTVKIKTFSKRVQKPFSHSNYNNY